ncbi:archaemetzincin-2-like [Argonauta hians]
MPSNRNNPTITCHSGSSGHHSNSSSRPQWKLKGSDNNKKKTFLIGNLENKSTAEKKLFSLCYSVLGDSSSSHAVGGMAEEDLFVPKIYNANVYMLEQTFIKWKVLWETSNVRNRCKCLFPLKSIIYLQPVGQFPDFISKYTLDCGNMKMNLFSLLQEFTQIYFLGFDVNICQPHFKDPELSGIKSRIHTVTGEKQFLSSSFFPFLRKKLPKDGYCILGITWTDLYPSEDLNFSLGESSFQHKSGVFCFGRFEPLLFNKDQSMEDIVQVDQSVIWRILKVTAHEICHLMGLMHCEIYACLMNRSTSLQEAMQQPMFLCPVCLRKLQKVCKFTLHMRYTRLHNFFDMLQNIIPYYHFRDSREWLTKCLRFISDDVKRA